MRAFVALFRTPTKGVSIDPAATEGAVVNENLFVRNADGSLSLFQPDSGTVTDASGTQTAVVLPTSGGPAALAAPTAGSNSGYAQATSPATAQSNYDLDLSMIAGFGTTAYPTINYILIGDGVNWLAKPMTGDAAILASGAITVSTKSKYAVASGTNTYTATLSPAPAAYTTNCVYTITFTNANTSTATLNLNSLGAKAIQLYGAALTSGQIPAGSTLDLVYDGTQFQIVGVVGSTIAPATVTTAGSLAANDYSALQALQHAALGGL